MILLEKKAKERYAEYLAAERRGDDKAATLIEKELNDAGWYIVNTADGMTVQRRGSEMENSGFDTDYAPRENNITPYSGDTDENSSSKKVWIAVGITVGIAALVILGIYLWKKYKKNANSK
jgi:hypothetical protein